MKGIEAAVIGKGLDLDDIVVYDARLIEVNEALGSHQVEMIGEKLRSHMADMKKIL